MIPEQIIRFLKSQPFESLILRLVNGRKIFVPHQEFATPGRYGASIIVTHPSGQVELIDTTHVVSIRTMYAAMAETWLE